jgi:predicted RNA-binding Zn ribbon-like protein
MAVAETQQPIFEFTGNNMCLDFCNTLHDRASAPRELLTSYDKLLLWGQQAHILTEDEAHLLNKEAQHHKEEAAAILQQAIDLREAIFRLLLAKLQRSSPDKADLDIFNASFSHIMAQSCIVPGERCFEKSWLPEKRALDRPLWHVVRSAADLLTTEELEDVRICASDTCNWLFLDTSKNHTRRWCDMKSCGNRAKARKHYSQKKQST